MPLILKAENVEVRTEREILLSKLTFTIEKGISYIITGPSGSGKTLLGKLIAGLLPVYSGELKFFVPSDFKAVFISQQHDFRYLFTTRSYYQQRFDHNYGSNVPEVIEVLQTGHSGVESEIADIAEKLQITHVLNSRLIELSSGEGKRVQIAKALLQKPEMIVLDNPFIGLDVQGRKLLHEIINDFIKSGITVIIISPADEIPKADCRIIEMKAGTIRGVFSSESYEGVKKESPVAVREQLLPAHLQKSQGGDFTVAVEMKDVAVKFGSKTILDIINWKVKKGECWSLSGPNGSGKSTLLSLINADNAQAYNNEIILFDKKRGSGESIWEIKEKIGYVSPELHLYFLRDESTRVEAKSLAETGQGYRSVSSGGISCKEVVASGIHDQIGATGAISGFQKGQIKAWMEALDVLKFKDRKFNALSLGDQRLVLLARSLVKNPPLLILDEPCQGLDKYQTEKVKKIIDKICGNTERTLIFVSHYADDIPDCVNFHLKLDKGKVV